MCYTISFLLTTHSNRNVYYFKNPPGKYKKMYFWAIVHTLPPFITNDFIINMASGKNDVCIYLYNNNKRTDFNKFTHMFKLFVKKPHTQITAELRTKMSTLWVWLMEVYFIFKLRWNTKAPHKKTLKEITPACFFSW